MAFSSLEDEKESESEDRDGDGPAADAITFEGGMDVLVPSFSLESLKEEFDSEEELGEATLLFRFLIRFRCVGVFVAGGMGNMLA